MKYEHLDDAGKIQQQDDGKTLILIGKTALLNKSLENYNKLMSLNDEHSKHFQKYLPVSMKMVSQTEMQIDLFETAICVNDLVSKVNQIDQPHVNWVFSRTLELATWLNFNLKSSHCGLNPDSLYVYPRTHGLVCISFYHLTALDAKITTLSGRYMYYYPSYNLVEKVAKQNIDIVCAQKIALHLMGDRTGLGEKFTTQIDINQKLVQFFLEEKHDCRQTYTDYRNLLRSIYNTNQFHELNV